ncbi:general secretion pathway protein K [Litorivivens lipolytica]|uniref:Type II secretion system protein K n=2 Tax=Litorivivens lipolytica TaxID=1524264 RepID=A0A7W4W6Q3_9GAMM|nr:general secretion pathway protein K [Litorivivens lipolytica]
MIFVLLVVATLSIVAVQITEQLRFNVKRLDNQRQNTQAYWYSLGGEQLARVLLEQLETGKPVHRGQPWATEDAVFPIDGGMLQGNIRDAQACFNVNNLLVSRTPGEAEPAPTASQQQFVLLLEQVGFERPRAELLRERIQDWLDSDFQPHGLNGAEDLVYSDRDQPLQTANRLMVSLSELNLMVELSAQEQALLDDMLCVLPVSDSAVNVNTLRLEQAPLLVALLNGTITPEDARQMLQQRPENGWESVAQLLDDPLLVDKEIPEDYRTTLAVQSAFFHATINVLYFDTRFNLQSLMKLDNNKASLVARRYGELF